MNEHVIDHPHEGAFQNQYTPNPPSQLSLWEETRSTRRKPTTFGRALTMLLSHEDWVRVHIKMT